MIIYSLKVGKSKSKNIEVKKVVLKKATTSFYADDSTLSSALNFCLSVYFIATQKNKILGEKYVCMSASG